MKIKLGKVVLMSSLFAMVVVLTGCGNNSNSNKNQETSKNNDGVQNIKDVVGAVHNAQKVSKDDVRQIQKRLTEIKMEIVKIQADESLSQEQKASKIQALQEELANMTNEAMGK